ncbi:abc-type branched-chain amino acid transport system, periplasmic component [hydrocarbon metagenome]|uniref:Abc-type branched-chain amino acid transport system, periplasmic component n=1 Tax=hydrocarbon metagenome TaxID=938273 RepID=A0A0W8E1T0_9ZZZZ
MSKGDSIIIGVPVPLEFAKANTDFLQGIDLALEDINADGINGKQIKLEIVDDQGNFKTAVDIAQEFSEDTRMVAVIGHWFSDICLPVSNMYEEAGILTIVPTVSNPDLTDKGYKYVFQNITSDKKIAEEMCVYAQGKGYDRVVVCYEESSYGQNLADAIEKEAGNTGIKIVDRSSGLVTEEQFIKAHDKWMALEFDAVLLAVNMPEGANFISSLRKMDQDVGIISADGLDVGNFIDVLGQDAEGVVMITSYSPYKQTPELIQFTQKYQDKYNEQPDVWAVQGYESLQLIGHAIKQTNSYSPAALADYLHKMEPWQTVLGKITFNEYGEIDGREVYTKTVIDGQFKYVD